MVKYVAKVLLLNLAEILNESNGDTTVCHLYKFDLTIILLIMTAADNTLILFGIFQRK